MSTSFIIPWKWSQISIFPTKFMQIAMLNLKIFLLQGAGSKAYFTCYILQWQKFSLIQPQINLAENLTYARILGLLLFSSFLTFIISFLLLLSAGEYIWDTNIWDLALKVVSAIFLLVSFVSLKESTFETR